MNICLDVIKNLCLTPSSNGIPLRQEGYTYNMENKSKIIKPSK
jgi:hypothetical protein